MRPETFVSAWMTDAGALRPGVDPEDVERSRAHAVVQPGDLHGDDNARAEDHGEHDDHLDALAFQSRAFQSRTLSLPAQSRPRRLMRTPVYGA